MKKIVTIGPESTGKSSLCEQLAEHYKTIWCPEYAREYLLEHEMKYNYDELLAIAKGQIALEEKFEMAVGSRQSAAGNENHSPFTIHHPALFIDTDMYVM